MLGMPVNVDVLRARISEINFIMNELQRLTSKPFMQLSVDEKYSMRYNVIVLVESMISLCIHIAIEAYSKTPASYREAIKIIAEKLNLPYVKDLTSMVGLRNILIHRYWLVDEKIYEAVKDDFKCLRELIGKVMEAFPIEHQLL
jgi:uncharacterized protein YutE (UPF0331/DUF86 family)